MNRLLFIIFLIGLFDDLPRLLIYHSLHSLSSSLLLLVVLLCLLYLSGCSFRLSSFNTQPWIIFSLITSVWIGAALGIVTWCIFNKLTENSKWKRPPRDAYSSVNWCFAHEWTRNSVLILGYHSMNFLCILNDAFHTLLEWHQIRCGWKFKSACAQVCWILDEFPLRLLSRTSSDLKCTLLMQQTEEGGDDDKHQVCLSFF